MNLSSPTSSTSPIAGRGPNIGHKTPTKVFAKTGVHSTEPQKTRARSSFFMEFRPPQRPISQLAPITQLVKNSGQFNCGDFGKDMGNFLEQTDFKDQRLRIRHWTLTAAPDYSAVPLAPPAIDPDAASEQSHRRLRANLGARLFQWGKADQSQHAGHKNKKSRRTA